MLECSSYCYAVIHLKDGTAILPNHYLSHPQELVIRRLNFVETAIRRQLRFRSIHYQSLDGVVNYARGEASQTLPEALSTIPSFATALPKFQISGLLDPPRLEVAVSNLEDAKTVNSAMV